MLRQIPKRSFLTVRFSSRGSSQKSPNSILINSKNPERKSIPFTTLQGKTMVMSHNNEILDAPTFPVDGLLPKKITEAELFISKNPNHDGRGTVVAILDTGVDPGAPGLAVTSHGLPKIIDCVDATGSGDVAMKPVTLKDGESSLEGLSKRKLQIPESWPKPKDGKYFLGLKDLKSLMPTPALRKHKADISNTHNSKITELSSKLMQENNKLPKSPSNSELAECKNLQDYLDKKSKMDHKMLDNFNFLTSKIVVSPDNSPFLVDCICFQNPENPAEYLGALDLSQNGKFENSKLMKDFKVAQEWSTLGEPFHVNYNFKFYENEPFPDGKSSGLVMSIVSAGGSHGTHVAGITGANFPEDPARNGVAPGCQLVCVKIGDTRVGTTETNIGIVRGINSAVENKADLINLSYGESPRNLISNNDKSIIVKTLKMYADKFGGLFVTSAGNSGPGLTSIGAPAGLVPEYTVGVGAQIFPNMMDAAYGMMKENPATQFTWSSRGPTFTGALGVSISAPGAAVTSVPNYTLAKQMLMNGTSMSSPNACGCLSLILSAAKQNSVPYSIYQVKRAIENTANAISNVEPWAQGQGLIQVDQAFDYLVEHQNERDLNALFKVSVTNSQMRFTNGGIYLREKFETQKLQEFLVDVKVDFQDRVSAENKINYSADVALACKHPWVEHPKHTELQNGSLGRPLRIWVDPTKLPEEGCFYTEIQGFDLKNTKKGPIFRIPITVVKSIEVSAPSYEVTGEILGWFFA